MSQGKSGKTERVREKSGNFKIPLTRPIIYALFSQCLPTSGVFAPRLLPGFHPKHCRLVYIAIFYNGTKFSITFVYLVSGALPGRKQWGGQKARVGLMASAEYESITGIWGQSPQRGPGAEPLVRGSGGLPPEAESILPLDHPNEGKICHFSLVFLKPPVSQK